MSEKIDLDALEALAKAAALDSWWSAEELGEALTEFNGRVEEFDAAEFIAAANPSTVLALVAELRQERGRADEANHAAGRHKSDAAYWENEYETAEDMKAELRAALSRAEETIDRIRSARTGPDIDAALTEYDKQKEADRG